MTPLWSGPLNDRLPLECNEPWPAWAEDAMDAGKSLVVFPPGQPLNAIPAVVGG